MTCPRYEIIETVHRCPLYTPYSRVYYKYTTWYIHASTRSMSEPYRTLTYSNTSGTSIDLLIFVFLPQRAPLARLWPLRAPTWAMISTLFSPFFSITFLHNLIFPTFVFVGLFFAMCTSMLSSSIYICVHSTAQHSTAQHSTAQTALHKAAHQARADQSAATQASTQSWREPASSTIYIQLAAFWKRTKKSTSAWPTRTKE